MLEIFCASSAFNLLRQFVSVIPPSHWLLLVFLYSQCPVFHSLRFILKIHQLSSSQKHDPSLWSRGLHTKPLACKSADGREIHHGCGWGCVLLNNDQCVRHWFIKFSGSVVFKAMVTSWVIHLKIKKPLCFVYCWCWEQPCWYDLMCWTRSWGDPPYSWVGIPGFGGCYIVGCW